MKSTPTILFILSLCLLCFGCAAPQQEAAPEALMEMESTVYNIGAEDVLEIAVWQNEDVSRTVTVRPDGNISLPLIDDIQASGLSPEELKRKITEKLKPFMTEIPEVSVIVLEANSKRFYVQGEVRTPGIFPLRSRTTVSQAITLAGGFTEFAKKNKIQIIRRWNGQPETIQVKYKKIMKGSFQDDVSLKPGDIIVVP
jgi:polysaccharide export outer membrane protein